MDIKNVKLISASSGGVKTENMSKQELAKELHKLIIGKFEK